MSIRALGIGFVAVGLAAAAQATTITHSVSQAITAGNSVACSGAGLTTANSVLRSFDLPAFGITNGFQVSSVDVGVESVAVGTLASYPLTINLWLDTDGGAPTTFGGDLTPLGSSAPAGMTAANNLTVVNIAIAQLVAAGSTLVVEASYPDGRPSGSAMWLGSNALGQTGPSYIAAADCGIPNPLNLAAIGFPNMHLVMNVNGTEIPEPASLTLLALGGLALLRRR